MKHKFSFFALVLFICFTTAFAQEKDPVIENIVKEMESGDLTLEKAVKK